MPGGVVFAEMAAVPFYVGTLAGIGVWFMAYLWLAAGNAPSKPTRGPVVRDLAAEPPAVAGMLVQGFRVPRSAMPATLIDLAARKHVEISLVAGGNHLVHVRDRERDPGMTAYEQQVLDHLRRIAVGGVVPASALSPGTKTTSRLWWTRFRKNVIVDAQARGLSVNRWSKGHVGFLGAFLTVLALPVYLAMESKKVGIEESPLSVLVLFLFMGALAVYVYLVSEHAQRDTRRGLLAAGRWLGVRDALAKNESFAVLPPSAVAVWERHLAYAAAMGLAPAACAGLHLGPEDDRLAWSSEGGRWRRVRVVYRLRPWWGMQPWLVGLASLGAALVSGLFVRFSGPETWRIIAGRSNARGFAPIVLTFGLVSFSVFVLSLAGLVAVVAEATRRPATVTGVVLRARVKDRGEGNSKRYFLAVDDGTQDRINAVCVPPAVFNRVSQGDRVTMSYSPALGYASEVSVVRPAASAAEGEV